MNDIIEENSNKTKIYISHFCNKCSSLQKNKAIEIKCKIYGKLIFNFTVFSSCFKSFDAIDKDQISDLLNILNYV